MGRTLDISSGHGPLSIRTRMSIKMERDKASQLTIATLIGLCTVAISGGMWLGAIAQEVDMLQAAQVRAKDDHDRLIKVETNVGDIKDDVKETKEDIKEIKRLLQEKD